MSEEEEAVDQYRSISPPPPLSHSPPPLRKRKKNLLVESTAPEDPRVTWQPPVYTNASSDEDLPPAQFYMKRAEEARVWLVVNREFLFKVLAGALVVLAAFFLLSMLHFSTLSEEERASSSSRYSAHLTHHETVKIHELDLEMAKLALYKTAADVRVSVFMPCTPVMMDEMAAGHVIIGEGSHENDSSDRREDDAEERYEHLVASIDEIVAYNERALGEDGFAAPKFWDDPVPGLNPCILSIRSPNGFVTHMINPVVLNERAALDDASYATLTSQMLVSYVDVFPFWTRKQVYHTKLLVQYNQWPGGEEFTRDLEEGSDVVLQIQDGLELLESSSAYDRFMDGPAVAS